MRAIAESKSPARVARRPLSLKGANDASKNIRSYPITTAQIPPLIKGGQGGFTLVEIIVSVVCFGILMTLFTGVFAPQLIRGTDPLFSMRAAELGQSYLEEILGKRFDENSPFGNAQRCNAPAVPPQTFIACTAAMGVEGESTTGDTTTFDDVDDYNSLTSSLNLQPRNQSGNVRAGYEAFLVSVSVTLAGGDIGLAANEAKRIDVEIIDPNHDRYVFTAYKANF